MDLFAILLLSGAFGLLVTAHVALVYSLLFERPRTRALLALVIPPLAPYWSWQRGRRVWSALWLIAAAIYVSSVAAASL